MSVIARGVKNVFRNSLRTVGFSVIIAVSLSLAFSMLLANQAVHERGNQLREDIGASLLVHPAGSGGGPDTAHTFTDSDGDKLAALPHVRQVIKATVTVAQHPEEVKKNKEISQKNAENNNKNGRNVIGGDGGIGNGLEISLYSIVEPQQLKNTSFITPIIPITIEGLSGSTDRQGRALKLVEGHAPIADNDALIGKRLAEKNNLKLGSTFTIKDKTFTVVGIFDAGTVFGDNRVIAPFDTVRSLQEVSDAVPSFLVLGDSLDNLDGIKADIQKTLENADVTILQQESLRLADSLKSIETISFVTLLVALAAGALTILLTMLLVVRERVKEIGILKALGATNTKIVSQFLAEALVLTLIGTVIGMVFAAVAGNVVLNALLSGSGGPEAEGPGTRAGIMSSQGAPMLSMQDLAGQLTTLVDWQFLLYGLGVAALLAIIGTAIPAFLIAKVRPAQIMRGDS